MPGFCRSSGTGGTCQVPVVASHLKAKGADFWGASHAATRLIHEAREQGITLADHVSHLVVHGVLGGAPQGKLVLPVAIAAAATRLVVFELGQVEQPGGQDFPVLLPPAALALCRHVDERRDQSFVRA